MNWNDKSAIEDLVDAAKAAEAVLFDGDVRRKLRAAINELAGCECEECGVELFGADCCRLCISDGRAIDAAVDAARDADL